ncbi:MAG: type III-B CRISPR module RAMP protein Cmr6 [Candidatus Electrothrix sp. AR4]|nr:type III-B CRISPR module RAMP protein Cmr6 [Candidatus Electrothrix sp. AR4]
MLPLYRGIYVCGSEPHPGLLFDKFPDAWADGWHNELESNAKRDFFNVFAQCDYGYLATNLNNMVERQEQLARNLCGPDQKPTLFVKTDWRFVSGLGSGHPYETGFIWHRTLGVPYLPGSSVKGLMRAWTGDWREEDDRVKYLFGSDPDREKEESADTGALIVFDALPITPPKLELDILNPHYGPYYESNGEKPPADYHNPVPVFFLTVASGQAFRFCLAPRPGTGTDSDVKEGLELLKEALETLGAGGKTAVGYGTFQLDTKAMEKELPKEERWRCELTRQKPKLLVNQFSKNWGATKKKYGDDLGRFIEIVRELHGDAIQEWKGSGKQNEQKAYKRIYP